MSQSLDQYESRVRLYCDGNVPDRFRVVLTASDDVASTYSGQVAVLVAASLFGRTFRDIRLNLPRVELHASVPHTLRHLDAAAADEVERALSANLREEAVSSNTARQTLVVRCGHGSADLMFAGSGWVGAIGRELPVPDTNPFGPAMAAVLAASEAFYMARTGTSSPRTRVVDTWRWSESVNSSGPPWITNVPIGQVWTVGVGSVGSAAIYFLSLATKNWAATLIDHDVVKIENVSRSPIFRHRDVDRPKVDVAAAYLDQLGIDALQESRRLRESEHWSRRNVGVPDLLISTANEDHVRWQIESRLPPVQVHASTGGSFQSTMFRHLPIVEPCSLCMFPDSGVDAPTACATGTIDVPGRAETVDAAVPFLSYSAGLMAAAEVWKVATASSRRDLGHDRACVQFDLGASAFPVPITRRTDCACATRSNKSHRQAIDGGRFAHLSRGP